MKTRMILPANTAITLDNSFFKKSPSLTCAVYSHLITVFKIILFGVVVVLSYERVQEPWIRLALMFGVQIFE